MLPEPGSGERQEDSLVGAIADQAAPVAALKELGGGVFVAVGILVVHIETGQAAPADGLNGVVKENSPRDIFRREIQLVGLGEQDGVGEVEVDEAIGRHGNNPGVALVARSPVVILPDVEKSAVRSPLLIVVPDRLENGDGLLDDAEKKVHELFLGHGRRAVGPRWGDGHRLR